MHQKWGCLTQLVLYKPGPSPGKETNRWEEQDQASDGCRAAAQHLLA